MKSFKKINPFFSFKLSHRANKGKNICLGLI